MENKPDNNRAGLIAFGYECVMDSDGSVNEHFYAKLIEAVEHKLAVALFLDGSSSVASIIAQDLELKFSLKNGLDFLILSRPAGFTADAYELKCTMLKDLIAFAESKGTVVVGAMDADPTIVAAYVDIIGQGRAFVCNSDGCDAPALQQAAPVEESPISKFMQAPANVPVVEREVEPTEAELSDLTSALMDDLPLTDGDVSELTFEQAGDEIAAKYPQYFKPVPAGLKYLDVYMVHHLFKVPDDSGALKHAHKKILLSGVRTGAKSQFDDIREARDALNRWLEINA